MHIGHNFAYTFPTVCIIAHNHNPTTAITTVIDINSSTVTLLFLLNHASTCILIVTIIAHHTNFPIYFLLHLLMHFRCYWLSWHIHIKFRHSLYVFVDYDHVRYLACLLAFYFHLPELVYLRELGYHRWRCHYCPAFYFSIYIYITLFI